MSRAKRGMVMVHGTGAMTGPHPRPLPRIQGRGAAKAVETGLPSPEVGGGAGGGGRMPAKLPHARPKLTPTGFTPQHAASYLILTVGAFLMAAPFAWMLSTALKSGGEVFLLPP